MLKLPIFCWQRVQGTTHHGVKSQILDCIIQADLDNRMPLTATAVLDGAVLIQMLYPKCAVTIGDYFQDMFVPYIVS